MITSPSISRSKLEQLGLGNLNIICWKTEGYCLLNDDSLRSLMYYLPMQAVVKITTLNSQDLEGIHLDRIADYRRHQASLIGDWIGTLPADYRRKIRETSKGYYFSDIDDDPPYVIYRLGKEAPIRFAHWDSRVKGRLILNREDYSYLKRLGWYDLLFCRDAVVPLELVASIESGLLFRVDRRVWPADLDVVVSSSDSEN